MDTGKSKWRGFIPLTVIAAAGILVVTAEAPGQGALPARFPIVRDWSHRYVVYTNASFRAATLSQLQRDPRLLAAWAQRNLVGALASASAPGKLPWRRTPTMKRDWAVSLGNVDTTSTPLPREQFPAMWGADITNPNCSGDFVVFGIRAGSSTGQANIVAFNNLYTNQCSGTVPSVMWAYYIGNSDTTPDVIRTSPVLSLNGQEVAFVENRNKGSSAYFHVLKWVSGQGTIGNPATPGSSGSWVRSVQYSASSGNRRSSPFVDYWHNVAFVGANNGVLYAIGPVFGQTSQTALSVLGSVTVKSGGAYLTSPVMDPGQNRLFISDGSTLYSYTVTYSNGSVNLSLSGSLQISTDTQAVQDSALVDIDRQRVFWFARQTGSGSLTGARVIETDYNLQNVTSAQIGEDSTSVIRSGAFDDTHYSNSQAGQLHVCGKASGQPRLYTFGFQNGAWQTNPIVNIIATSTGECSPLTTFKSGAQDRLFLGFSGSDQIQMWNIPITSSGDVPDATASGYNGGSAGIIVDNRASQSDYNNIYFQTPLASSACGNNVCAVKLTQSGLQ